MLNFNFEELIFMIESMRNFLKSDIDQMLLEEPSEGSSKSKKEFIETRTYAIRKCINMARKFDESKQYNQSFKDFLAEIAQYEVKHLEIG